MQKILIFSLAYYPHVGGAEVAVKEITDRITDLEFHMVTMRFAAAEPRQEKIGNVLVHRIGRGGGRASKFFFQLYAAWCAHRLNKKYRYDAVWTMMAHSTGVPAALFKMWHPEVPYILNLQEGDSIAHIEKTMRPLWPLFARAFTKADIIQPLSHYLAAWARARHFTGPIEIIPNGVDVQAFAGAPILHPGVVLITTSRLVHKNAVDTVIRALPLLPRSVRFQILGIGPEETKLKGLATELDVSSRVEFLGHISHAQLPAYLHAADIFIRPSRTEGFGASFMEAMAAGLPVIATQEGGIADFLFDAKRNPDTQPTGWAVDVDSPQQIAAAVNDILANRALASRVVENAKANVTQKYDWDLIARDMRERVFGKVLKTD